jgi:hypothetical protein
VENCFLKRASPQFSYRSRMWMAVSMHKATCRKAIPRYSSTCHARTRGACVEWSDAKRLARRRLSPETHGRHQTQHGDARPSPPVPVPLRPPNRSGPTDTRLDISDVESSQPALEPALETALAVTTSLPELAPVGRVHRATAPVHRIESVRLARLSFESSVPSLVHRVVEWLDSARCCPRIRTAIERS